MNDENVVIKSKKIYGRGILYSRMLSQVYTVASTSSTTYSYSNDVDSPVTFAVSPFCYQPVYSLTYLLPSVLQQNSKTEQVGKTVTDDELTSNTTDAAASVPQLMSAAVNEEEVDIDLGDPEVQKAAVFIQSGFKGFKQRKISQGLAKVDCRTNSSVCVNL